ncbi:variant erythrocyte surface antigen-1 alpha subunit [Babesia bovis T2Bo]|uniref:variant erythrocyte surface antigen-1 alpha subunit n=1 Tax=Babesia bovis T2Bo TaxID=484906 RepID=UPI001C348C46|nr:variant erythrocyte surface antigen-1 alpha subunit [Babesia bovis T2Bo]EDO05964.2 variant erythrocyte surface antigen-1 alpha subunit [Babesia bovis T2Bo]
MGELMKMLCTEVIGTLIDHLALGLQKWVGWQEGDTCCLKGDSSGKSNGIGKNCERSGAGIGTDNCCSGGSGSHDCTKCGTSGGKKCYQSAYSKTTALWTTIVNGTTGRATTTNDPSKVHLLARIFLGTVCLIWSGLSQLGFLTGGSGGNNRWSQDGTLSEVGKGLGSFMAAMGYDLERLNGSSGPGKYCLG